MRKIDPTTGKCRLSMEAMRDIDTVVRAWHLAKISASKARELSESIVFDKVRVEDLDPIHLGGSEAERVLWALSLGDHLPSEVSERLSLNKDRVAQLLSRLARRGDAVRVAVGVYVSGKRNEK